jgi:hypothetical protein
LLVAAGTVTTEELCFCGDADRVDLSNIFLLTVWDLPPKADIAFLFDLWPARKLWEWETPELETPAVGACFSDRAR